MRAGQQTYDRSAEPFRRERYAMSDVQTQTPPPVTATRRDTAAAPDERDLKQRLIDIFRELVEVRVVTVVGDVNVTLVEDGPVYKTKLEVAKDEPIQALVTIFDLVGGDVTSIVHPALRDDEALRAYHSEQVKTGLAVLPD